ncbi:MAG: FKBP-type peptidyl-prolyl cis-trans isomerase [Bacteroidota bacterium]
MIKRILPIALLGTTLISQSACNAQNKDGFKKTPKGLEYKIVTDAPGDKKPKTGDFVEMHLTVKIGDSVLFDSRKNNNGQPIGTPLPPAKSAGDSWVDGVSMMTPGDSAVMRISVDSIIKEAPAGQVPPFMKKGTKLTYYVKLVSVKSAEEKKKEMEEMSAKQKDVDDKMIQEYLTKNNVKAQKTASGLYYVIEKEGTGATAAAGKQVTVNYTGKTLDGKTFDSNVDPEFKHVQPFTFGLGQGQVIKGWDEGVALLKKGGKGMLYIPSTLAYGPNAQGPIAPNSILMFSVEVTDIKDSGNDNAPQH